MTQKELNRTALGILLALFAAFGFLTIMGVNGWIHGKSSESWKPLDGQLISFEPQGSGSKGSDRIEVRYKYEVDGSQFEGTRLRFGFLGKERAKLQGWHAGSAIRVWVNPDRPADAVLFPGPTH